MTGKYGARSPRVQSRDRVDFIDRFFEWSEGALCPHHVTKEYISPEENSFDYVFEHVESFACNDGGNDGIVESKTNAEAYPYTGHPSPLAARDNSLVDTYKGDQPKKFVSPRNSSVVAKPVLGKKGDFLDYCFENVESFACGDAATGDLDDDVLHKRNSAVVQSGRVARSSHHEPEDAIQLYYKPKRTGFSKSL
jgi:hypothetical protein